MRKFPWNRNPKINWWLDNDTIRFYQSVDLSNLSVIDKVGLKAAHGGPESGNVALYLDPYSAKSDSKEEQAILIIDLPFRWMLMHMSKVMDGDRKRLTEKGSYEQWTRTDHEYYKGAMVRIKNVVPRRFVTGFMVK